MRSQAAGHPILLRFRYMIFSAGGARIHHLGGMESMDPQHIFNRFDLNRSGGANAGAGSTANTGFRGDIKGSGDVFIQAPTHKGDRTDSHLLFTDPDTKSAEDTVAVPHGESGLLEAHFPGHFLNNFYPRISGQQQFHQDFPVLQNLRGMSSDLQPLLQGIVAGGDNSGSPSADDFHDAETAGPKGRKTFMVA